ncbi:basic salivary proline-rich protein 2-like isoform X2 [Chiroxiphia lanceolata]|uniref:basic salivary proline-rich protein 2-like isoform X2 n=1 Tax=Chiroxiphia lanceolata TaxID=296741 RepID=UPI0013CF326E|nr:basic salivary proline-rich protein 2-like isoform X2 [Chiroxiphia lanceolata]
MGGSHPPESLCPPAAQAPRGGQGGPSGLPRGWGRAGTSREQPQVDTGFSQEPCREDGSMERGNRPHGAQGAHQGGGAHPPPPARRRRLPQPFGDPQHEQSNPVNPASRNARQMPPGRRNRLFQGGFRPLEPQPAGGSGGGPAGTNILVDSPPGSGGVIPRPPAPPLARTWLPERFGKRRVSSWKRREWFPTPREEAGAAELPIQEAPARAQDQLPSGHTAPQDTERDRHREPRGATRDRDWQDLQEYLNCQEKLPPEI